MVAFTKNCGILQTRMDHKGDNMKMNFDYFQIQKMNITNRVEKVDEKMRSFVWFLIFLSELWTLICLEK